MKKPIVSASIMCADLLALGREVGRLEKAGVDWLHIDVMDGRFVPNKLELGPKTVSDLGQLTNLPIDIHLMTERPQEQIPEFVKAGLEKSDMIVFHWEATEDPMGVINQIQELGTRAGIALKPNTPTSVLRNLFGSLDMILIMTVEPGFAGQQFIEKTLPKIRQTRKMIGHRETDIQVDGGLTMERIRQCAQAGANIFVAGTSSIFTKEPAGLRPDIAEILEQIHSIRVNR